MKMVQNLFTYTGAVLLFILAAPLFLAASSKVDVLMLRNSDALFLLSERHVLYCVSGLELSLSAFLLMPKRKSVEFPITAWVATNILIYQAYSYFYGDSLGCLANLANNLPVLPKYYDYLTFIVLSWLLIWSITFIFFDWGLGHRRANFHVNAAS